METEAVLNAMAVLLRVNLVGKDARATYECYSGPRGFAEEPIQL